MNKANPNCDGSHCTHSTGQVRVLPYSPDGNVLLCFACYLHELKFRIERNREASNEALFDTPPWESLKIYPID